MGYPRGKINMAAGSVKKGLFMSYGPIRLKPKTGVNRI